jgi:predicted O-linked N-acetylglucosamine transferase (SPINDLY family)
MSAMDYRLTDDFSDPPGTDEFYTEKLVRLPRSFFCYRPSPDAPAVGPLPARARGYVTFGSFNNFAKVTPEVLSTWARVLHAVPGSRLSILSAATEGLRDRVGRIFEEYGVDPGRVEHCRRRPRAAYLELISQVDMALDPFPFNGHTTTCDALWQGVPVITLSRTTYASRFGGSGLATLGLDDLIAKTTGQYVDIATRLATDLDRLEALRAELRPRMAASPLLDFTGFTRNLEAAYRRMWTDWCDKQAR